MGAGRQRTVDWGLALVRVWLGAVMALQHGLGKLQDLSSFVSKVGNSGFPLPWVTGTFAALSESVAAVLLLLGWWTRTSALALAGTMCGAAFVVHAADPFQKKELALTYAVVCLALALTGPGRLSVDGRKPSGR